jgi:serine O-acetyltransferase
MAHPHVIALTSGTLEAPELGDRVFVGTGAKILGPVRIGDGAIIGAGSVVLKNVPAHDRGRCARAGGQVPL